MPRTTTKASKQVNRPNPHFVPFKINFRKPEHDRLAGYSRRTYVPMATVIRLAMGEYLDRQEQSSAPTSGHAT